MYISVKIKLIERLSFKFLKTFWFAGTLLRVLTNAELTFGGLILNHLCPMPKACQLL